MDSNEIRKLIKKLNIVMRCPSCGKRYDEREIHLKDYRGNNYNLLLRCSRCGVPVSATIAISSPNQEMSAMHPETMNLNDISRTFQYLLKNFQEMTGFDIEKMNTPMPQARIEKPQKKSPKKDKISNDDILDLHKDLEKFDDDLEKLL